jgi:hypothetical protein
LDFEERVAQLEKSYFVPPSRVTDIVSMIHHGLGNGKTVRVRQLQERYNHQRDRGRRKTTKHTDISDLNFRG